MIAKVHHAIRKDKVGELRDVLAKHIPKEALFLINGLVTENYKIALPLGLDDLEIETSKMSMLECACVFDNDKRVFKYLVEEAHVNHSRDFHLHRPNMRIHEQFFIFVPMLKKNWSLVKDLLQLSNRWSLKQLEDLMLLSK